MLQLIFEKLINMNITVNIGPSDTAYQGNPDCPKGQKLLFDTKGMKNTKHEQMTSIP